MLPLDEMAVVTRRSVEPNIIWKGAYRTNYRLGRTGHEPLAIVVHTMGGSLVGTDAWFNNADAQVSAHFGVGLNGEIHQYVHMEDTAYANGILEYGNAWPYNKGINPNLITISIETEGQPSTPVTPAMFVSVQYLIGLAKRTFPSIELLTSHHVISPLSRANCAGIRWMNNLRSMGAMADLAVLL